MLYALIPQSMLTKRRAGKPKYNSYIGSIHKPVYTMPDDDAIQSHEEVHNNSSSTTAQF